MICRLVQLDEITTIDEKKWLDRYKKGSDAPSFLFTALTNPQPPTQR